MDETAQPAMAAETDPIAQAAEAFKTYSPEAEPTADRPRDESGRFVSNAPPEEGEEINTDEGEEPEAVANDEETPDDEDAAEEAQQSAVEMPSSWSKDDADVWTALPPEAQAKIAEREGQRDAAVNQKFQEAANARHAAEAAFAEAQANRQNALAVIDLAATQLQYPKPPLSMLDINSSDYNPDEYHLRNAQADAAQQQLQQLAYQRQQLVAQEQADANALALQQAEELNRQTGPALIADFPDAADQTKAQAFFTGLVEYALKSGAPATYFQNGPVAAVEWHIIAKARAYDELQAAKAKVQTDPKPEPRKAQPAVRPGVATSKSAIVKGKQRAAFDRLAKSGSIDDAAAYFRTLK